MQAERVAGNLLALARLARSAGMPVDAGAGRLLLRALAEVDLARYEDVHAACAAVLVRHPRDRAAFELAFRVFWALLRGEQPPGASSTPRRRGATMPPAVPLAAIRGRPRIVRMVRVLASAEEVLRGTDFAAMSAEERAAAARFLARLRWSPGRRPSRRFRAGARGPRLDARATLRRAVRDGGEPIELLRRVRRPKRRPLVLLCDISGSMEPYARLLLHLCHALTRGWGRVEAFTFGTRLTRITRHLRQRNADAALARIAPAVPDWSGGTRIGDALAEFNRRWSRRVLGRGAVVLLCSDGWERGDAARLAVEAARLRRASYRLLWLDPLAATAGYEPSAAGARALVRHVDDHLAAATLDSLAAIATLLERAGRGRPVRRQDVRPPDDRSALAASAHA